MISKKIVLIGDFSVGKTSLIRRFVDNQFSDTYLSTIGVKISRKEIVLPSGTVQGLIWDVEGGTETKPVNRVYLTGADGCIIVADVTREETIEHIETYIDIIHETSPKAVFIVVLNKADCLTESEKEQLETTLLQHYEEARLTSAKSGEGVEEMFETLAGCMMETQG
jgi:small GTP-binding protein